MAPSAPVVPKQPLIYIGLKNTPRGSGAIKNDPERTRKNFASRKLLKRKWNKTETKQRRGKWKGAGNPGEVYSAIRLPRATTRRRTRSMRHYREIDICIHTYTRYLSPRTPGNSTPGHPDRCILFGVLNRKVGLEMCVCLCRSVRLRRSTAVCVFVCA